MLVLLGVQRLQAQDASISEVARISVVQGDVFSIRGDSKDWLPATANAPAEQGDCISTGPDSRTELQLDSADMLRMGQNTNARVAELNPTRIRIQLAAGQVDFAVFKGSEVDLEIDTANIAIHPLQAGLYRVEVRSGEAADVTIRRGRAEVISSQGSVTINNGQVVHVMGKDNPEYQLAQANEHDAWDDWNDNRDRAISGAQAWQFTNSYYTGSEDLDRYGDWMQVRGFGWCWAPYAEAGWVPYRNGRWVSDAYYRWIWVGYEPWGWAPYHYGRWLFYAGNWCWWPGVDSNHPRPLWAPGYVAFLGFSGRPGGTEVGWEFDSIGWAPLGPREPLNAWWGKDREFDIIDVTNADAGIVATTGPSQPNYGSNLQRMLTDVDLRPAINVVSAQDFANGRMARGLSSADENLLQQASLIRGTLPVTPIRASLQPVNRPVNRAALPPEPSTSSQFFARNVEPAEHASAYAGETQARRHRPSAIASARGVPMPQPARPDAGGGNTSISTHPTSRPAGPPATTGGWRRFHYGGPTAYPHVLAGAPGASALGEIPPSGEGSARVVTPPSASNADGWRKFSPPNQANAGARGGPSQQQEISKHSVAPPKSGGDSAAPRDGSSAQDAARVPLPPGHII
jgi:hypothetical protein